MIIRGTPTRATWRLAIGLALLGAIPSGARAAPPRCDRGPVVSPATIPAGSQTARVRIPVGTGTVQLRAAGGTTGALVNLGTGSLVAELKVDPGVPFALVGAVGGGACGFAVVRVARPEGTPPAVVQPALLMVDPPESIADRDADVLVHVFALDEQGSPRRGGTPALRPTVGSVSGVEAVGPGVWLGRWRIPAGEASAAGIEARFGSALVATASIARVPGAPARVELTREVPAAGGTSAVLLARVRDSAGNLTDAPLGAEASAGNVDPPSRIDRGTYRIAVDAPWAEQIDVVTVTARADGAVATITIQAPSAETVRVAKPVPVRADGSAKGTLGVLDVEVLDAAGGPAGIAPVGSGTGFEFRTAVPAEPGHWTLSFRPPRVLADTKRPVTVRAGAASATVDVDLVLGRPSFQVGAKAGLAIAGGSVGPAIGVEGGVWTVFGRTQLGLVVDIGWWTVSQKSTVSIGGVDTGFESTQAYVPVLLSVAWRTPVAERWMLWATLGGGGAGVSSSSQVSGQPKVGETGFAAAASASVSAGPRLGPGFLVLEARGTWIGDAGLSTLSGSVFSFLGLVGYRFDAG